MENIDHYNNLDIDYVLNYQDLNSAAPGSHFTCDPYIEIIEQPKQRGFRFRYGCEGPSHGGLPGVSSEKNKKTYPTVKVHNYTGPVKIVVQLVTIDEPPLLHVHSLVGRQCKNGICVVQIDSEDMTASFPNLGVLHVPKKDVAAIIEEQLIKSWMSDINNGNMSPSEEDGVEWQEKHLQNDIQVRFYQEDESGHIWEAFGKFSAADVHRQFAIVFKTPKYFDLHITKPISVFVQLRRRSDGETSEPKPFIYYPHKQAKKKSEKKWQKTFPNCPDNYEEPALAHRGIYGDNLGEEMTVLRRPECFISPSYAHKDDITGGLQFSPIVQFSNI
ncbi:nuclear factor NF-kappa-B p105 subunit-like isoform X3 [Hemitrygon akajei]|uniref:nuclear factor NF-kappa-B p105 subunit-like isoform X3 n=1 Tax=Hemitrygon akajei TaxID=2704970 RepID=UPI003BF9CED3